MKTLSAALLFVLVCACGGKSEPPATPANNQPAPATAQTEGGLKQDLERICNAFELSGTKPDQGLNAVGPWLEQNVQTPEGKQLLEQLKAGSFDEARAQAKQHEVVPCPMLDPHGQQAAK